MGDKAGDGNLLTALVSGATAAAVAGTITYPFDSLKTQQQLNNPSYSAKFKIPGNFPGSLAQVYRGGSALVCGNVIKTSARLIAFNWATQFMAIDAHDSEGHHQLKSSAPRIVIAGGISGFIETLWLIPFENIKITMVQNMTLTNEIVRSREAKIPFDVTGIVEKHHKPIGSVFAKQYVSPHAYWTSSIIDEYRSGKSASRFATHSHLVDSSDILKKKLNKLPTLTFLGTINDIYKLKGIYGFTQGTFITFTRQVGTSIVWFWTYNATRQLLDPKHKDEVGQNWFSNQHSALTSLGSHFLSSFAVIALTQPFDVVKSHLQSKNGKSIYSDSLSTAYKLFINRGWTSLFKGALPRGLKVLVSGGLTAGVYSYVEQIVTIAGSQTPFGEA